MDRGVSLVERIKNALKTLFVAELELGMCVFGVAHPWAAEESSTIHGPQTHIPSSTQQKGFLNRLRYRIEDTFCESVCRRDATLEPSGMSSRRLEQKPILRKREFTSRLR